MAPRVRLDVLLVGVATTLLAAGLAVAFVADAAALVPGPVAALDDWIPQAAFDHVAAVALGCYVLWRLLRDRSGAATSGGRSRPSDDSNAPSPAVPVGARTGDAGGVARSDAAGGRVVGETYTRSYQRRLQSLRSDSGAPQPAPLPVFREAAAAVERARGHDASTARERVESGTWTDDPVAAAFVGGPGAGRVPLWRRLRGVVSPAAAFEARAERTLAALETAAEAVGSDSATTGATTAGTNAELGAGTGTHHRADGRAADSADGGAPEESSADGSDSAVGEGAGGGSPDGERAADGSGAESSRRFGTAGGDRPPEV